MKQELTEKLQFDATETLIKDVMKQELGMKWAKIKKGSVNSNSERNLILR